MDTEEQKAKLASLRKEMDEEITNKIEELKRDNRFPICLDNEPKEIKDIFRKYYEKAQEIKRGD